MRPWIVDLDGSVLAQPQALKRSEGVWDARSWGSRIRMGCSFGRFRRFMCELHAKASRQGSEPLLTFTGSGDFHHVSLALLARLTQPFNLLMLDKHPDWMRRIPLMHCGTWLLHALRLPTLMHVYHVGGALDFDNAFRFLAPWSALRSGRVKVFPALNAFRGRWWHGVPHTPLRAGPTQAAAPSRLEEVVAPLRKELAACPLYITVDKDVLVEQLAAVNWDSGYLELGEVCATIRAFAAPSPHILGADILGDWSPVRMHGMLRRFLHWTEHPALSMNATEAAARNERANLALLECIANVAGGARQAA